MKRIVAAGGEHPIHVHQVLDAGDFGAQDDAVVRHPRRLGERGGAERALDHRFHGDVARVAGIRVARVGVHHLRQETLVERAPVHADPHRLPVGQRHVDDRAEVLVRALAADVAGVDPILGEGAGAGGMTGEEEMAVIVEVADDRHRHAEPIESLRDVRHGRGGLVVVHRHPDQLAAGTSQRGDLAHRGRHVRGVRVGHGLDHDRVPRPDGHPSDPDGHGGATDGGRHGREYNFLHA